LPTEPVCLSYAKAFEDLGVAAYNGAGYLIKSADYLTLAGKIVSVEARHAALIRLLLGIAIEEDTIVNVSGSGLELSQTPQKVLDQANQFISGKPLIAPNLM